MPLLNPALFRLACREYMAVLLIAAAIWRDEEVFVFFADSSGFQTTRRSEPERPTEPGAE
jgi:hypothetical protein